jgi:hypothetical protein
VLIQKTKVFIFFNPFKSNVTISLIRSLLSAKEGLINLINAYGVNYTEVIRHNKLLPGFTVHALKYKNQDITERPPVDITFIANSKEEAQEWVECVFKAIQYNADWAESESRKPVYIIVNPAAGNQEALKIYQQIVVPMLECARLKHMMIGTNAHSHIGFFD